MATLQRPQGRALIVGTGILSNRCSTGMPVVGTASVGAHEYGHNFEPFGIFEPLWQLY